MGFSHRMLIAFTATGLGLAVASPALAQDAPPPGPVPASSASFEMMGGEARNAWLAECRNRLGHRGRKERGPDRCLEYLDSYYAYYRAYQGSAPYGAGSAYPVYGQAGACCHQPVMMVPMVRAQRPEPKCKKTVEYEYFDVPVRAVPRPKPDKRVKIVPDKRIPVK